MSVRIRLMRMGKRHRPFYRVCVVDQRNPRDGAYIECVGHYNPFIEDDSKKVNLDKERAEHWLSVGAQPSETVASFLKAAHVQGVIKTKKPRKRRPPKTSAQAKARAKAHAEKKKQEKAKAKAKKEKAAASSSS